MTRLLIAGVAVLVVVELVVATARRDGTLLIAGLVLAVLTLLVRSALAADRVPAVPAPDSAVARSLNQWVLRTESLLEWADGSRAGWDRHLRPLLAREFRAASGQRHGTDAAAFDAVGRAWFGDRLWVWVNPNPQRANGSDQAPGRAVLAEILDRLIGQPR